MRSPWNAARDLAAALAAALADRPLVLDSHDAAHPPWCAADHRCTAHPQLCNPAGEHRSPLATWRTAYGLLHADRTKLAGRRGRLTVQVTIPLPDDEDLAERVAFLMVNGMHLTASSVLAKPEPETLLQLG